MNILRRVPESVLWLSQSNSAAISNLKKEAQSFGIDPNRIIFAEKIPHDEYMVRHKFANIFLDTFYYNAGSTAVCALASGLPIITLAGSTYASRMSSSINNSAGLPELICTTIEGYENMAVYYATHTEKLIRIKEKLTKNKEAEPLFNIKQFVGYLDKAYLKMWEVYKNGKRPQSFNIDP